MLQKNFGLVWFNKQMCGLIEVSLLKIDLKDFKPKATETVQIVVIRQK